MDTLFPLGPLPPEVRDARVALAMQGPKGAVRVLSVSEHVALTQTYGHLDAALARELQRATLELANAHPPLLSFGEWSQMIGYDREARQLLTDMILQNRTKFAEVSILTGSTMVSVGVNTAGLATALVGISLTSTTDRRAFFEKLRNATR
jgi:hypothetical protein